MDTGVLSTWYQYTPYRQLGFYVGGPNLGLGCVVPPASWVSTVNGQGWGLTPIWVGAQAPNSCYPAGGPYSYTVQVPNPTQLGQSDAGNTISALQSHGFPVWTTVYLDMESYTNTPSCNSPVVSYISGWVGAMRANNYTPGVYGGEASTIAALTANPGNQPQDVWIGCWWSSGGTCPKGTVWSMPDVANSYWTYDQRLAQWQGGHCEQYPYPGGPVLKVDSDSDDGDVTWGTDQWMNEHVDELDSPNEDATTNIGWENGWAC
jgi:hypothetical protein